LKGQYRSRDCLWWDVSDLTSWSQASVPVRVVRSEETYPVRRQSSQQLSWEKSEWMWVTTLPAARASTALVVHLGHARWDIENYVFNELVNGWHADHIYKHDPSPGHLPIESNSLLEIAGSWRENHLQITQRLLTGRKREII
jgi:hypothetical protein